MICTKQSILFFFVRLINEYSTKKREPVKEHYDENAADYSVASERSPSGGDDWGDEKCKQRVPAVLVSQQGLITSYFILCALGKVSSLDLTGLASQEK